MGALELVDILHERKSFGFSKGKNVFKSISNGPIELGKKYESSKPGENMAEWRLMAVLKQSRSRAGCRCRGYYVQQPRTIPS
jgi:hypothetical protein